MCWPYLHAKFRSVPPNTFLFFSRWEIYLLLSQLINIACLEPHSDMLGCCFPQKDMEKKILCISVLRGNRWKNVDLSQQSDSICFKWSYGRPSELVKCFYLCFIPSQRQAVWALSSGVLRWRHWDLGITGDSNYEQHE